MIKKTLAHTTRRLLKGLARPVVDQERVKKDQPRGVALIIALVTLALLSSAIVEYMYSARVNLSMATNQNDKIKSYFFARSAVNLTRLMLSFQIALQKESGSTDDDMGRLISRAMRRSNFQIHQYVDLLMKPFHSGKLETPVGGLDLEETGVEGFGDFTGEFSAHVTPESGRIDINQFFRAKLDERDLMQLCSLFIDAQYDALFSYKDDYGELIDRARMIQNLVDFIDPDQTGLSLSDTCTIAGNSGDERRPYDRLGKLKIGPRDAKLTHPEDLYLVHGVTQEFMDTFADKFTVYNVGKPNINAISSPMFYSILCQGVRLIGNKDLKGYVLCAKDPSVGIQVLWFAMALDGVRAFFEDPISVLLAYIGTQESKLLPSAKKGQPVAFLSVSQLPQFIKDFTQNPLIMAQFIQYSPFYQQLVLNNPQIAIDPLAPNFPQWSIEFDRNSLTRAVTTKTPQIYRIVGEGSYGSTKAHIEVVLDMNKTQRRLPDEKKLAEQEQDTEDLKALKNQLREEREQMPKGRVLFWREY